MRRYLGLHRDNLVDALRRLRRQPFATLLTVLVIAIALALPAGLRVLVNNLGSLSGGWQGAADFTVYFKLEVPTDRARSLAREIASRPDVASVQFVDRGTALEDFRAHSGFGTALDALEGNPLPDALVVRPASGAAGDVEGIAAALRKLPETDLVQLDTQWVARLRALLALATRIVGLATVLLGLAVAILVGNTIRLEIQNRSAEIEVTKLVGGTDGFIRRPFLYLGLCYGLTGGLFAYLLILATLVVLRPSVSALAALYDSQFALAGLSWRQTGVLLGGGALLGWAGAWLATARHLRAVEPR
jgi:cell division transport system permease protein